MPYVVNAVPEVCQSYKRRGKTLLESLMGEQFEARQFRAKI